MICKLLIKKVKTNIIVKDKISNNNNLIIEEWKMESKKMLTKDNHV